MILSHVIALDPTEKQKTALVRAAGCARFAYNWGLTEWARQHQAGLKPTANKLKKAFNAIKGVEFPWIYDSPKDANQEAFADLGFAFSNFFTSLKGQRKGRRMAYPGFKKKGSSADSFGVSNTVFHFHADAKRVYLPVIGSVKIKERLRFEGKIMGARVKRIADRWYLSVQVQGDFSRPTAFVNPLVGIDLGVKTAITPSRGEPLQAPKPLKAALIKLKSANRKLQRRKKGSANRRKARIQVAKIHAKVANIRKDFMHKATTRLARENQTNVIEDLNVHGMLRNHKLARAISDVGFGMFRQFMTYKAPIFGSELIVANRWFPSSKTCHVCLKHNHDLTLSDREWACQGCGVFHDRDDNAATMLEMYPRLMGEHEDVKLLQTPMDDHASTPRPVRRRASKVVEVGTES